MRKNLTHYFTYLLTVAVLLTVTFVGSAWLWETLSSSRRDIAAMHTTYMQEQHDLLKSKVELALQHISYMQSKLTKWTEDTVQERTNTAWMIADALVTEKQHELSPDDLENLIRETLRRIRYPDQGYYFAINIDGTEELFTDRPELEGTNMLQVQDPDGKFVIRDMLEMAQEDKTLLYQYSWTKPNQGEKNFAKIAAIRYLPAINWVIGTGMYLDDMERQIQDNALEWLEHVRWGKEKQNYLFAGQRDGLSLTGPSKGKNMLEITDPNGVRIVQELINRAQAGGGFIEYVMPKLKDDRPAPKLAFAAPVKQWKWYIGTGRYIDEIQALEAARKEQLNQQLFSHLWQTTIILVLLCGIVMIMVLFLTSRLKKNIDPFSGFFHQAATEMAHIDEQQLDFEEFHLLARDANHMVQERSRIQRILSNQEDLLNVLTRAGHHLLSHFDLGQAVEETLAILGAGCKVERVYLFEIDQLDDHSGLLNLRFEWTADNSTRLDDPRFQRMKYTSFKAAWFKDLLAGKAIQGTPEDFSEKAAAMMREYDIKSLLMLPVLYRDTFWGLLCFDACATKIHWANNSIHSLQNFTSTLCTAIMQRRSEQETIAIRDQWITTFNSIEDAIFLLDDSSTVINANRAALQTVKADNLAAIAGRPLTELMHGKEGRFDTTCLADRLLEQDTPLVEEVHSTYLDKTFMSSVFPMHMDAGQRSGVIYIARDITREKSIELQLAQAQKMEAIGVLAGGIAHDFNNILAAIMGFAELAQFKLEAGKADGLDADLKQISQAGTRAKDLVTQLLAFSRNQTSPKTLLTVTPIIKETIKMLKAFIPANIHITTALDPETGKVLADGTGLHQVFMNLGNNAAHAMKAKGGELHISLIETTPSLEQQDKYALNQENYLHITFSDQGTGVDPLIIDKIFDPFFTTKKVDEGTGMGLAAVHGIVEEHGGFVELDNQPGQGASFHLWFPQSLEDPDGSTKDIPKKPDLRTPNCGTVLVVDDEEMLRMMLKEMFEILDCKALTSNTPEQALELLQRHPDIGLLCTDLNMPEMNGLQLAEKCHQIRPNLPVILCSGLTADIQEEDIKRAGIDKIIAKPINLAEMKNTLHQLKQERAEQNQA